MEVITTISLPSSLKFLNSPNLRRVRQAQQFPGGRIVSVRRMSSSSGDDVGKLVDENMIVLRLRISEIKSAEEDHQKPLSGWMKWEKGYTMVYNELVFGGVGILQNYLMNVRPSLGIGLLVLVALSLGISSLVVFFHVLNVFLEILSKFHIIT